MSDPLSFSREEVVSEEIGFVDEEEGVGEYCASDMRGWRARVVFRLLVGVGRGGTEERENSSVRGETTV